MSELETLFALAEIAVGMAGFSAIVVLFKRRESGKWRSDDADRFNGMLIHAMAAAFFCVLPAFVEVIASQSPVVWSVSSAVLGLQIAAHGAIVSRLPSTTISTRVVVALGALVAVTFQVLNVFGWAISPGFVPYLIGVLWHLFQAGTLFVLLIWVRPEDVEREP